MKNIICLICILSCFSVFASNDDPAKPCIECSEKQARGLPSSGNLEQVTKLGTKLQTKKMEDLSNEICAELVYAQSTTGENSGKVMEKILLKHLNITKKTPHSKKKLTQFWNKNLSQMVCTTEVFGLKSPQHVLKRVIDMGINNNVYFNFVFELEENVNVNAIENGETVIDYIDSILSDPDKNKNKYVFRDIKDLREVLIEYYGAKKASDV